MELDHEAELRDLEIEVNEFVAWCKNIRNTIISGTSSIQELQSKNETKFSDLAESCQIGSSNKNNPENPNNIALTNSTIQEGGDNDFKNLPLNPRPISPSMKWGKLGGFK